MRESQDYFSFHCEKVRALWSFIGEGHALGTVPNWRALEGTGIDR